MKKAKFTTPGLKALNDMYIIKEDPIGVYHDSGGGLTDDVTKALKSGKLFVPEQYENFSKKYPCTGEILAIGDTTRYKLKPGVRVCYGRLGGQRQTIDGDDLIFIREKDLLAVIV